MTEKIIAITEYSGKMHYGYGDGYKIITNKQEIVMLISNGQSCCENWGYFFCNDDPQDFVGADVLAIKLTDDALNEAHFKQELEYGVYDGGVMFVNIETNIGTLQFVAYNAHNGYYSHAAHIKCKQLEFDTYL